MSTPVTPQLQAPQTDHSAGPWSMGTYGSDRIANLGVGACYQTSVLTKDPVDALLPPDFLVESHIENKVGVSDNYEKIVTARKGDLYLTFNETASIQYLVGYSADVTQVDEIRRIVTQIKADATPIPVAPDDSITTSFWRMTPNGPTYSDRRLLVPHWDEISNNYASAARHELEALNSMTGIDSPQSGNLVILHGPAGTGKTTALRALARSWKPWADTHYIIDPDQFLGYADYMWQAVLGMTGEPPVSSDGQAMAPRWKLLIMEDTDELISSTAKEQVGQSFSRLLNLGDGFLGQGARIIIVLTTNKKIDELAGAIIRPGRCLANIEVPRFSRNEAIEWLGSPSALKDDDAKTLAELYELQANTQMVAKTAAPTLGQYL